MTPREETVRLRRDERRWSPIDAPRSGRHRIHRVVPVRIVRTPAPTVRRPTPRPRPRPRVLVPLSTRPAPAPAVAPGSTEALLAEVLAGVLDRVEVPTDAHVFDDLGADSMVMAKFCARVRKHPDLPSIAIKDVYTHPTIASLAAALAPTPTPRSTEVLLAEVLAGVLDRAEVPTDAHVFDDLGADSMVMAKFCARVRKHPDLPSIAIKDVYTHPTIASLAAALAPATTTELVPATRRGRAPDAPGRATRLRPVRCGPAAVLPRLHLRGRDHHDLGLRVDGRARPTSCTSTCGPWPSVPSASPSCRSCRSR